MNITKRQLRLLIRESLKDKLRKASSQVMRKRGGMFKGVKTKDFEPLMRYLLSMQDEFDEMKDDVKNAGRRRSKIKIMINDLEDDIKAMQRNPGIADILRGDDEEPS